jgi:hypothetical protein
LVKKIDEKISKNNKLKSFVVLVPKKGESPRDVLESLAKDASIKHVPLTIGEAPDGPPDYAIAKDADVTVLMWNQGKVKVNHAFKGALAEKDIKAVVDDVVKVLEE